MRFRNRHHAGKALAEVLRPQVQAPAVIYALPRGGVPVGAEIALALGLPLELVIPRKIGHPYNPEYAICAVTETGEPVCNEAERKTVSAGWLEERVQAGRQEAHRRRAEYRGGRPRHSSAGKCAVLVDDGIATGLTMLAAIQEVKTDKPSRLIVAVPVAPPDAAELIQTLVDRFVAVDVPAFFIGAVGSYYEDFRQTTDDDVMEELARVRHLDNATAKPEAGHA